MTDEHKKYYEYAYHNKAVNLFTDKLKEIEDEIKDNPDKNPRLWCHIKTANAICELLDTWEKNPKPTE